LHALAHDLAELAGQYQSAASWNTRRLNEQDVAADGSPGKPGRDARHAGTHGNFVLELRRSQNSGKIAGTDVNGSALAPGNADRGMPQDFRDLAFQAAHSRLPCVERNDVADGLVSK